jgi:hypothetical protein
LSIRTGCISPERIAPHEEDPARRDGSGPAGPGRLRGLSDTLSTCGPARRAGDGRLLRAALEANRFRVNFSGNSYTERATVENYLLLRAAELTLSQGYDWFTTVERDTERRTRYRDTGFGGPRFGSAFGYPGYGYGYGGFSPYWRYHGRAGWSPFYDPFGWDRDVDIREINRYEATAEIVLGRGPKPANDPRAFDAREVAGRLAPYAGRPV